MFNSSKLDLKSNSFFRFSIRSSPGNQFDFLKVLFEKSRIDVNGKFNILTINNAFVSHSTIKIDGQNNKLIVDEGVKLRSVNIIIRGDDCLITIGKNTTFGGIRIINVGKNNTISIGEDCLFADHIELWASDSHPIFNNKNQIINNEKPVVIGNKVWIGSHVIILKGTTIADGSIIGMGTLVTNNVPPNTISVGNPNRIIKNDIKWSL
jgi:acetyltransferase-like isoleucine patch superfamily enzyme